MCGIKRTTMAEDELKITSIEKVLSSGFSPSTSIPERTDVGADVTDRSSNCAFEAVRIGGR